MASFDQNSSAFCFLVLNRAIVIYLPLELQNLRSKNKNKMNSVSCSEIYAIMKMAYYLMFYFHDNQLKTTLCRTMSSCFFFFFICRSYFIYLFFVCLFVCLPWFWEN